MDSRRLRVLSLFATLVLAAPAAAVPIITSGVPDPLVGPNDPSLGFFTGTFEILGSDFFDGEVLTDGPLLLVGPSLVNGSGDFIARNYSIGCCGPFEGQTFDLFVTTPEGIDSLGVTIHLSSRDPAAVSEPATLLAGAGLAGISGIYGRRRLSRKYI
jgi:hypothetical protein